MSSQPIDEIKLFLHARQQHEANLEVLRAEIRAQNAKIEQIFSLFAKVSDYLGGAPTSNKGDTALHIEEPAELADDQFIAFVPERYSRNFAKYSEQASIQFDPSQQRCLDADLVRFYFFGMVFDLISRNNLPGDIAEIGVYKGYTAKLLADFARKAEKKVYLIDTFQGFSDRDLQEEEHLRGAFSDTSLEGVQSLVGTENCVYIEGYFPDTAENLPEDGAYCLVHIDCDLYQPVLSALRYFYDRMVDGGFIIMHDYMSLSWDGPAQAIDEFFLDKPESIVPIPDYAGTVLLRKSKTKSL